MRKKQPWFGFKEEIHDPLRQVGAAFLFWCSRLQSTSFKLSAISLHHLFNTVDTIRSLPILSLPGCHPQAPRVTSHVLADAHAQMSHMPCDRGCRTVEPVTGIDFPAQLSPLLPEVLVATGSRTMTIIKIKSLKVYAFGFYIHPNSVCRKLGSKYASVPLPELKDHNEFYEDLLREDIGMTLRLVVNCSGMKINTVKDAFEKSLRVRLLKTNPDTDFKCISTFGSHFTKDIPLPVGTIIDFRRTADGQLITEIEGNQVGAVDSRELCRAFFDMYLGEVPVSKQTKEEIGRNVASIIRSC